MVQGLTVGTEPTGHQAPCPQVQSRSFPITTSLKGPLSVHPCVLDPSALSSAIREPLFPALRAGGCRGAQAGSCGQQNQPGGGDETRVPPPQGQGRSLKRAPHILLQQVAARGGRGCARGRPAAECTDARVPRACSGPRAGLAKTRAAAVSRRGFDAKRRRSEGSLGAGRDAPELAGRATARQRWPGHGQPGAPCPDGPWHSPAALGSPPLPTQEGTSCNASPPPGAGSRSHAPPSGSPSPPRSKPHLSVPAEAIVLIPVVSFLGYIYL